MDRLQCYFFKAGKTSLYSQKMKHILVTGGCGYTGTVLINNLVDLGNKVTVIDTQWFGNYLKTKKKLNIIKLDIRDHDSIPLKNVDIVIHLASIANDPSVELNSRLSWEVNVLATQKLIENSVRNKVSYFKNFEDIFKMDAKLYAIFICKSFLELFL